MGWTWDGNGQDLIMLEKGQARKLDVRWNAIFVARESISSGIRNGIRSQAVKECLESGGEVSTGTVPHG